MLILLWKHLEWEGIGTQLGIVSNAKGTAAGAQSCPSQELTGNLDWVTRRLPAVTDLEAVGPSHLGTYDG